jgi:glycosyltransferase involved in cell wall biosynthesis
VSLLKSLRIAFLTPEFLTEDSRFGGLAAYVYRISKALKEIGHRPEIFTLSYKNPTLLDFEGIRVERVKPYEPIYLRLIFKLTGKAFPHNLQKTYKYICFALAMRRALQERERGRHFDFVHSSDYLTPGLFVRKAAKRPILVRSSWARDLCLEAVGRSDLFDEKCVSVLERRLLRRADIAYAPSKFVAAHYRKHHNLKMHTLRPPFLLDTTPATDLPWKLPGRFLLHFATVLGPLKGTDTLALALPLVWHEEPDFKMVWAGREHWNGLFLEYSKKWGNRTENVVPLGKIERAELYAVIKMAEATILPSRYDNLPNTAIESLALGVPVIGPNGASFDEMVEPGFNGELIPPGNPPALAEVLLRVWRRQVDWIGEKYRRPTIFDEMEPHVAASNLIRLAGFST